MYMWSSTANRTRIDACAEFRPDLTQFDLRVAHRVSDGYKRQKWTFQTKYNHFYFEKSKIGSEFLFEIDFQTRQLGRPKAS